MNTAYNKLVHKLSAHIDSHMIEAGKDPEAITWGRVAKIMEEAGEAVNALIGATNQNFRKGQYATTGDVYRELQDVALTAILACAHIAGNNPDRAYPLSDLLVQLEDVADRAGLLDDIFD